MAPRDQIWTRRQHIEDNLMTPIVNMEITARVIVAHARDLAHGPLLEEAYRLLLLVDQLRTEASREWKEAEERAPNAQQ